MADVTTIERLNTVSKPILEQNPREIHYPQDTLSNLIMERGIDTEINTEGAYIYTVSDSYNYGVVPGGRNVDFPYGGNKLTASKAEIYVKEFYANAAVTYNDMINQRGGNSSDVDVVAKALLDLYRGRDRYLTVAALGAGTGQLATLAISSAIAAGSAGTLTATNTYLDLGWDNTVLLAKGMTVEIYRGSSLVATGIVGTVNINRKRNATNTQTGTFTFTNTGESSYTAQAGDAVYWNKTYGVGMPMGLRGIVNPGFSSSNPIFGIDGDNPFQGHFYMNDSNVRTAIARTADEASIFRSQLWRPNDNDANFDEPLTEDNLSDHNSGTVVDWDLNTLSQIIDDIEQSSTNENSIDMLMMNRSMLQKLWTLAEDKVEISSTWAGTMGSEFNTVFSTRLVSAFMKPDGTSIPIMVERMMPNNEIMGLATGDLIVARNGQFDFARNFNEIWQPTFDRKDNFEAPYRGFINFGSTRCDSHFCIQGLKGFNE